MPIVARTDVMQTRKKATDRGSCIVTTRLPRRNTTRPRRADAPAASTVSSLDAMSLMAVPTNPAKAPASIRFTRCSAAIPPINRRAIEANRRPKDASSTRVDTGRVKSDSLHQNRERTHQRHAGAIGWQTAPYSRRKRARLGARWASIRTVFPPSTQDGIVIRKEN
jgi:hypothetical protein